LDLTSKNLDKFNDFTVHDVNNENRTRKAIMVDMDCCVGCEECVYVCPTDAISMVRKKAVINLERCNLCGACVSECPVKAIKIE
jgi:ferredoxin